MTFLFYFFNGYFEFVLEVSEIKIVLSPDLYQKKQVSRDTYQRKNISFSLRFENIDTVDICLLALKRWFDMAIFRWLSLFFWELTDTS